MYPSCPPASALVIGGGTALGLAIGGLIDLRKHFTILATATPDHMDAGMVVDKPEKSEGAIAPAPDTFAGQGVAAPRPEAPGCL